MAGNDSEPVRKAMVNQNIINFTEPRKLQEQSELPLRASLMGLPVELRLKIFAFHFHPRPNITIHGPVPNSPVRIGTTSRTFAIANTCKQLNHEALTAFYSSLLIPSSRLRDLPSHHLRHVRTVHLFCRCHDNLNLWACKPAVTLTATRWPLKEMWRYLRYACPELNSLTVRVDGMSSEAGQVSSGSLSLAAARAADTVGPDNAAAKRAVLPSLESVVFDGEYGPADLKEERRGRGWDLFEELIGEVICLSGKVTVTVGENWIRS